MKTLEPIKITYSPDYAFAVGCPEKYAFELVIDTTRMATYAEWIAYLTECSKWIADQSRVMVACMVADGHHLEGMNSIRNSIVDVLDSNAFTVSNNIDENPGLVQLLYYASLRDKMVANDYRPSLFWEWCAEEGDIDLPVPFAESYDNLFQSFVEWYEEGLEERTIRNMAKDLGLE